MLSADTLSRLPESARLHNPVNIALVTSDSELPINVTVIAGETANDPLLRHVMDQTLRGWPVKKPTDPGLALYYGYRNLLNIDRKCVM